MGVEVEPGSNLQTFGTDNETLKLYYGATSWGRKEWIGKIYPERTKEKDFLNHYVQHYNAVEVNATHYQSFTPAEIRTWADKAEGRNFLFCPKFPQSISHYGFFVNLEDETRCFLESISAFGNHLGPVVFEVSSRFSPKRKEALYTYLQSLPKNIQVFLNVAHPDWFEERPYQEHLTFLKENAIGCVINDAPGRIVNETLPLSKCFIKYTPAGDLSQVLKWFEKIKEWARKGLTEAYFFVAPGSQKDQQLEALQYFKELVTGS